MNTPYQICLVDDDQDIHYLFDAIFDEEISAHTLTITHFDTANDCALYFASNKHILNSMSIICTDIEMPGMNGIELTKTLKKQSPELTILCMTASANHDYASKAIRAGSSSLLSKPLDIGLIKRKILRTITH